MSLNKQKLETISYGGFDVENIEVVERQLRELVNALDLGAYSVALGVANAIQHRTTSIVGQIERVIERRLAVTR